MPFDGIDYQGASLIPPYNYHPHAPMTGRVLFHSLRGAYFFARNHSRLVGCQTYRLWNADAHVYDNVTSRIESTSMVDIARFRRRIPAHMTHVGASIWFKVFGADTSLARHQIIVTDGSGTDSGAAVEQEIGLEPLPEVTSGLFDATQVPFEAGAIGVGHATCLVDLANVTLPATCTITVEGHAIDTQGTPVAMAYRPYFISCWMWSQE